MTLKVNRIASGFLAETCLTKFVGEAAITTDFLPAYESLCQNLDIPDDLQWPLIAPHNCAWDAQRELWLFTAHRHKGEDINHAAGALVLGRYCVPSSTHQEISVHVAQQVEADLRFFGKSLLAEATPRDLELLTQRGSPPDDGNPESDTHRRVEVLEAQALQQHLSGWAQAIALFVRPEYRRNHVASHLLRIAKRNLVEQASPSLGLFGKAPISSAAFWIKVGARFYLGRELPDEKIFAITWGRRDGCGDLLDMFVRCADELHRDDVAVGEGDVDVEIPF